MLAGVTDYRATGTGECQAITFASAEYKDRYPCGEGTTRRVRAAYAQVLSRTSGSSPKGVSLSYIKAFIFTAVTTGILAHYFAQEPMRWWPDAFIFGGFMGAMAAFVVMRVKHTRKAAQHLKGAGRAIIGKRR